MGFKANIDIALSFSNLKFCSVRQQGQIKFRVCIYYTLNNNQEKQQQEQIQFCHPYSILRKSSYHHRHNGIKKSNNIDTNRLNQFSHYIHPTEQSQIDLSSDYYLSKPFRVMFEREIHHIQQTCCFRTSIDIQKYEDVDLKCQVQLLFCANTMTQQSAVFKTIGKCQCKVRKIFDISAYLPIVFDQFEGVVIQGVYQAALIDFKYQREPFEKNVVVNPENFHQYLKKVTSGFNRAEVRNFYKYYRELLEKQLFSIQERHYDLVRVMGISSSYEEFRILKINPNSKIETMIDHLGGYNSHQNPYFQYKKSLGHMSTQSLSTTQSQTLYLNGGIISRPKQSQHQQSHLSLSPTIQSYKQQLSQQITYDYLQIKALIYKKWSDFLEFTTNNIISMTSRYRNYYNSVVKERLSGNVFSHRVQADNWKSSVYEDSGEEHLRLAETDRRKDKELQLWKESFLVQNQAFFMKDAKNIKIFEQIYPVNHRPSKKPQKLQLKRNTDRHPYPQIPPQKRSLSNIDISAQHINSRKSLPYPHQHQQANIYLEQAQIGPLSSSLVEPDQDHFIILVHGFQASRQDFVLIKNCLEIRFKIKVYISTCNEGRTDDDIEVQGKRLALEIQKYINQSQPSANYRLSFLGHSMGGIIVRAALCYLQNVEHHLSSYISLSTPHLGYLYQASKHIQAGLWLLGALQKTSSIEQICIRDSEEVRKSFLYRLSQSNSLNKFKHLCFVGSHQDKYVPYQSARIQYNGKIVKNGGSGSGNAKVIEEMIQGLLGGIQCIEISRIDVIFSIQQSNFDTMIGRTAHIRYLSDRQFIKVFCIVFEKFFK